MALDTRKPGVVATLKGYKTRGKKAIAAAAKLLDLTDLQVRTAVRYYGASPEEVDERIEREVADADAAEEAWRCEQAALA